MRRDITAWVQLCHLCQSIKVHQHNYSPVMHILVPNERSTHVHLDLVGPLTKSQGFNHIFTVLDRFTKGREASATAPACAQAFLLHLVSQFRVPSHLTLDRASNAPMLSGRNWPRLETSSIITHCSTIYRAMEWWSAFITLSVWPCSLDSPLLPVRNNFPGPPWHLCQWSLNTSKNVVHLRSVRYNIT